LKTLLITQTNGGQLDYLNKKYSRFFKNFIVIPIPTNGLAILQSYINIADAVVLSDGPRSQERDELENGIISKAVLRDIPLLGIGEGALHINRFFGGEDVEVTGHDGTPHEIMMTDIFEEGRVVVNSFHKRGITSDTLSAGFNFFAVTDDGIIEGIRHKKQKVYGVQWFPHLFESGTFNDTILDFFR
jgi:gamma-glutamyl-gamma-aminobutyrate hydrolase PuuD